MLARDYRQQPPHNALQRKLCNPPKQNVDGTAPPLSLRIYPCQRGGGVGSNGLSLLVQSRMLLLLCPQEGGRQKSRRSSSTRHFIASCPAFLANPIYLLSKERMLLLVCGLLHRRREKCQLGVLPSVQVKCDEVMDDDVLEVLTE